MIKEPSLTQASHLFLLLALALLLQHLLDDLLLLDQECADNSVTHAVAASGAAVCSLDGLLGLRDLGVLAGTQGGDLNMGVISICRRGKERTSLFFVPIRKRQCS